MRSVKIFEAAKMDNAASILFPFEHIQFTALEVFDPVGRDVFF